MRERAVVIPAKNGGTCKGESEETFPCVYVECPKTLDETTTDIPVITETPEILKTTQQGVIPTRRDPRPFNVSVVTVDEARQTSTESIAAGQSSPEEPKRAPEETTTEIVSSTDIPIISTTIDIGVSPNTNIDTGYETNETSQEELSTMVPPTKPEIDLTDADTTTTMSSRTSTKRTEEDSATTSSLPSTVFETETGEEVTTVGNEQTTTQAALTTITPEVFSSIDSVTTSSIPSVGFEAETGEEATTVKFGQETTQATLTTISPEVYSSVETTPKENIPETELPETSGLVTDDTSIESTTLKIGESSTEYLSTASSASDVAETVFTTIKIDLSGDEKTLASDSTTDPSTQTIFQEPTTSYSDEQTTDNFSTTISSTDAIEGERNESTPDSITIPDPDKCAGASCPPLITTLRPKSREDTTTQDSIIFTGKPDEASSTSEASDEASSTTDEIDKDVLTSEDDSVTTVRISITSTSTSLDDDKMTASTPTLEQSSETSSQMSITSPSGDETTTILSDSTISISAEDEQEVPIGTTVASTDIPIDITTKLPKVKTKDDTTTVDVGTTFQDSATEVDMAATTTVSSQTSTETTSQVTPETTTRIDERTTLQQIDIDALLEDVDPSENDIETASSSVPDSDIDDVETIDSTTKPKQEETLPEKEEGQTTTKETIDKETTMDDNFGSTEPGMIILDGSPETTLMPVTKDVKKCANGDCPTINTTTTSKPESEITTISDDFTTAKVRDVTSDVPSVQTTGSPNIISTPFSEIEDATTTAEVIVSESVTQSPDIITTSLLETSSVEMNPKDCGSDKCIPDEITTPSSVEEQSTIVSSDDIMTSTSKEKSPDADEISSITEAAFACSGPTCSPKTEVTLHTDITTPSSDIITTKIPDMVAPSSTTRQPIETETDKAIDSSTNTFGESCNGIDCSIVGATDTDIADSTISATTPEDLTTTFFNEVDPTTVVSIDEATHVEISTDCKDNECDPEATTVLDVAVTTSIPDVSETTRVYTKQPKGIDTTKIRFDTTTSNPAVDTDDDQQDTTTEMMYPMMDYDQIITQPASGFDVVDTVGSTVKSITDLITTFASTTATPFILPTEDIDYNLIDTLPQVKDEPTVTEISMEASTYPIEGSGLPDTTQYETESTPTSSPDITTAETKEDNVESTSIRKFDDVPETFTTKSIDQTLVDTVTSLTSSTTLAQETTSQLYFDATEKDPLATTLTDVLSSEEGTSMVPEVTDESMTTTTKASDITISETDGSGDCQGNECIQQTTFSSVDEDASSVDTASDTTTMKMKTSQETTFSSISPVTEPTDESDGIFESTSTEIFFEGSGECNDEGCVTATTTIKTPSDSSTEMVSPLSTSSSTSVDASTLTIEDQESESTTTISAKDVHTTIMEDIDELNTILDTTQTPRIKKETTTIEDTPAGATDVFPTESITLKEDETTTIQSILLTTTQQPIKITTIEKVESTEEVTFITTMRPGVDTTTVPSSIADDETTNSVTGSFDTIPDQISDDAITTTIKSITDFISTMVPTSSTLSPTTSSKTDLDSENEIVPAVPDEEDTSHTLECTPSTSMAPTQDGTPFNCLDEAAQEDRRSFIVIIKISKDDLESVLTKRVKVVVKDFMLMDMPKMEESKIDAFSPK